MQLLAFSQLFADIVQLPGFGGQTSYLAYLAPGQIAFTSVMVVAWASYGLLIEYRTGYLDKLRANPIGRWSILAGEMVPLFLQSATMSGILLVVSLLLGVPLVTGAGGFLLIIVLCGAFGVAFAGSSFIPALLTKSEQATSPLGLLVFPLAYVSTALVPEALMPAWARAFSSWNPITHLVEAIRALMLSGWDWGPIGTAVLSIAVMGAILQAITLWAFDRLAL